MQFSTEIHSAFATFQILPPNIHLAKNWFKSLLFDCSLKIIVLMTNVTISVIDSPFFLRKCLPKTKNKNYFDSPKSQRLLGGFLVNDNDGFEREKINIRRIFIARSCIFIVCELYNDSSHLLRICIFLFVGFFNWMKYIYRLFSCWQSWFNIYHFICDLTESMFIFDDADSKIMSFTWYSFS